MKIKEITVWYSQTVQPRQYESIRANMEITVEVWDENVEELTKKMQDYVNKKVMDALPNHAAEMF